MLMTTTTLGGVVVDFKKKPLIRLKGVDVEVVNACPMCSMLNPKK